MTDATTPPSPAPGHTFQVVVDARDPHAQADWWAETLQWEVEPQDEAFIRSMIAQGFATDADTTVHRGHLVWREGCAINAPDSPGGGRPRVLFQLVPEGKTVKNRVHLDVDVDDLAEAIEATEALGATRVGEIMWDELGGFQVMSDPEGNEFCLILGATPIA